MALGPSKYNDLCTYVREKVHARGAVVIIVGGDRGQGMAVQITEEMRRTLPKVLRSVAKDIEDSIIDS